MGARPELIGKMIVDVDWARLDSFNQPAEPNTINSIIFSDGSSIVLSGSGQVGVDEVWVDVVNDFTETAIDALELLRDIAARDDRPHYLPRVRALLAKIDTALAISAAPTTED